MQGGKFPKIKKFAGCDKAGGLEFSKKKIDIKVMQAGNFPKINKIAKCDKTMQVEIFQKLIKLFHISISLDCNLMAKM